MKTTEKLMFAATLPFAAMGVYEVSGEAWGLAYENGSVQSAQDEVECAELLVDIDGPLPQKCDEDKLEEFYLLDSAVKVKWISEDGVLVRQTDVGSTFDNPKKILGDAEANLERVKSKKGDYEHERGLQTTVALSSVLAAGGVALMVRRRRQQRPEGSKRDSLFTKARRKVNVLAQLKADQAKTDASDEVPASKQEAVRV